MKIKESRIFNDVFIRISLPSSELEKKKVLRHAIKANLIKSNTTLKCVFNNYSFKYEIHELKNNKIDWRNIVSEKNFQTGQILLVIIKNLLQHNLSIQILI